MKIIETERVYLRELVLEDAQELSKVLSDPESMRFYPEPFSREKVERWIEWNITNYKTFNHGLWAVILKDGEKFIGDCGITMQKIDGETVPEIGFHILKDYWKNGYASEAALACKQYAFKVMNYPSVFSYTTIRNIASQKVAEKIGMHHYKVFEKNGEKQIVQIASNPEVAQEETKMKIVIGFSGGKDSTLALYKIQNNPDYEVDSLLVTLTEGLDRVSIHGVRYELLQLQAKALGIPLREVWIPQDCPNEKYQEIMGNAISEMKADGVTHIAFGDLHLQDVREYRENMLEGTGITPIFPLWKVPVEEVSREFIDLGFKTVLTCIDMDRLDPSFVGRVYDRDFLRDYPKENDICGENGEFHSFAFDGPNFQFLIPFKLGEQKITPDYFTKEDRFLYIDLIPIKKDDSI
jgi:uncharacterized protein (TIGR00290 family)